MYKSRLLGYVEYRTSALYHATDSTLLPLDKVQDRFLRALDCTELDALMHFNLAPLAARRDIAMLGIVHRAVLGKGPEHFRRFFKPAHRGPLTVLTRGAARRHEKQLDDPRKGNFPELLRRSALGLVAVYNLLPAEVVAERTVPDFQKQLQLLLKKRATANCEDWAQTLSPRVPVWRHPLK